MNAERPETRSIRRLLAGSSTLQSSSSELGWSGAVLEEHVVPAGEKPAVTIETPILLLYEGENATRCSRINPGSGGNLPLICPRTLRLYAPGNVPPALATTSVNLFLCSFDVDAFQVAKYEIEEEIGQSRPLELYFEEQMPFQDPALRRLVLLLRNETSEFTAGRFYAEHLFQALMGRLIARGYNRAARFPAHERIPPRRLSRLLERIHADPTTEFDLATLASETGFSKRHFLRTFRATMGITPCRYVLRLRLERARQLMQKRALTLLEIAVDSGFSSHAHLSTAFRQEFGLSPSEYRRSL